MTRIERRRTHRRRRSPSTGAWNWLFLLLLARPAGAQAPEQPPAQEGATTSPVPADEQPVEQPPSTVSPDDTTRPNTFAPEPSGTATMLPSQPAANPNAAPPYDTTDAGARRDTPVAPTVQPAAQVQQLVLTVDRRLARPDQPFTFTVAASGTQDGPGSAIQVAITRNGALIRRLRAERDGRYVAALPPGSYEAQAVSVIAGQASTARPRRSTSNRLSVRVIDPSVTAGSASVAQAGAEAATPPGAETIPVQPTPAVTPAPASWPWQALAGAVVLLLAIGGGFRWLRSRRRARQQPPSEQGDPAAAAPRLSCNARVSHELALSSPLRIRFRLSARAVPDHGRQSILPPSTPAPKLEDAHGRRADRP